MQLTVGQIAAWMNRWYPPSLAAEWDRVGLIVGSREAPVSRVLLAVDPVEVVLQQAVDLEVDMLITHHPLYLRGTSFVSEDDAKGRLVTRLIRQNVALFNAHTNADVAPDGVAQALADAVGLREQAFLEPLGERAPDCGYGRIGTLPSPTTLRDFAEVVARALPAGPTGLLVGGALDRTVTKVAVSGGSGDSFLRLAAARGVDAYVTADLRHHPASEHLEEGGPALICGSHWATEWPWLPVLARRLAEQAQNEGTSLQIEVSSLVTEPWTLHLPTTGPSEGAPR